MHTPADTRWTVAASRRVLKTTFTRECTLPNARSHDDALTAAGAAATVQQLRERSPMKIGWYVKRTPQPFRLTVAIEINRAAAAAESNDT
jgi:hypothetical protein